MQGQTEQTWRKMCERAVVEKDPDKLLQLVKEINRLLDEKEARLQSAQRHQDKPSHLRSNYLTTEEYAFKEIVFRTHEEVAVFARKHNRFVRGVTNGLRRLEP
jgi:hypothetical protein